MQSCIKLSIWIGQKKILSHILHLFEFCKNNGGTGYEIIYDTKSDLKKATTLVVKGETKVSKTITGLKSKSVIYVKIRAYREENGNKFYSVWSPVKNVKVK